MFESIMNSCPRKKVVSLCKKLIKKCSFNSGEDARNLCSLGYRLFIYGHIDEALAVSRYTHNVPFPGRGVFNVWTFILCLWGLEVFILKAQGKYEEADVRIKSIDYIHAQPLADESAEKVEKTQTNCILRLLILMYCAVRILMKIRITLMNVVLQPFSNDRIWRNRVISKSVSTLGRITAGHK